MSNAGELSPGTVFAKDFRIVRKLAAGGMGSLYVAEQLSTGRQRALKLMHPGLVGSPELREKFALEARVGARIESEHAIEVVAAGVDDDIPWLAMELLVGADLSAELKKRGRFSRDEVARVLGQVGHALAAAHRAGIVHRDLKPENVLLAETRRMNESYTVKLLDFGIAKVVEAARGANTGAVGTPLWMAPEQSERDAEITPSTDVWAFGLLAFKMLTGRSFWLSASGEGVAAILREVVLDPIPSASERAQELDVLDALPPGFDAWFSRCVCRDPKRRFPNAEVASAALFDALGAASRIVSGPVRISVSELDPATREQSETELGVAHTVGTPAALPTFDSDKRASPYDRTTPLDVVAAGLGRPVKDANRDGIHPSEGEHGAHDDPNESATVPLHGASSRLLIPVGALLGGLVLVGLVAFAQKKTDGEPVGKGPDAEAMVSGLPFCAREMARVPSVEFSMGSIENGPPRLVRVAPYCIDLTEVSAADYAACVKKKGCADPVVEASWPGIKKDDQKAWTAFCTYGRPGRPDHPMNCVTFDEAASYCRFVGKRLPNEEEWEYAGRGKDGRSYPWGNELPLPTRVNGCDEGCAAVARVATAEVLGPRLLGDDGAEATSPVGSYLQGVSPSGSFDFAGNVAEWVDAPFCPYGQTSCGTAARVVRGGSWATDRPAGLLVTTRGKASPQVRMPDLGFRCAK